MHFLSNTAEKNNNPHEQDEEKQTQHQEILYFIR